MRFLPSLFSYSFLHLVSFSLQCYVCVLLYCVLTVLCQVALTSPQEVLCYRNAAAIIHSCQLLFHAPPNGYWC